MAWKNKEKRNEYQRNKYKENPKKDIEKAKHYFNSTKMGRAIRLVNNYNWMDKKANRENGDLTPIWVIENIFSKPCAHCGIEGWKVIGCNRLDNSKPHTMDNVEPCCEHCNHVLGGKMKGKKVYQYTLDGVLVKIWENGNECAQLGFTHVHECCNGKRKTNKGYIWSYNPL